MIPIVLGIDTIAENGKGAIDAVIGSLEKLAKFTIESAENGDKVSDAWSGVGVSIRQAQQATDGEVDELSLLQAAARATALQLGATGEQFGAVAGFAKRFADVTGGDAVDAIDSMLSAIATGRAGALRRMGIELQDGAKGAEAMEQVLAQIPGRMDAMGRGTATAGDAIARMNVSMDNFLQRFSVGLTETNGFVSSLDDVAERFERAADTAEALGVAVGMLAALIVDQFSEALGILLQIDAAMGGILQQLGRGVIGAATDLSARIRAGQDARVTQRAQEDFLGNIIENGPGGGGFLAPLTQEESDTQRRRQANRRGGGGGGGQAFDESSIDENFRTVEQQMRESYATRRQLTIDYYAAEAENRQTELEQLMADGARFSDAWNEGNAAYRAAQEERVRVATEARRRLRQEQQQELQDARQWAYLAGGVLQQGADMIGATEADKNHLRALSEMVLFGIAAVAGNELEAAGHLANAIFAESTAQKQSSAGRKHTGGLSAPTGAGASFAGGAGGAGADARGGDVYLSNYFEGPAFMTRAEVDEAIHAGMVRAARAGRRLPADAVARR